MFNTLQFFIDCKHKNNKVYTYLDEFFKYYNLHKENYSYLAIYLNEKTQWLELLFSTKRIKKKHRHKFNIFKIEKEDNHIVARSIVAKKAINVFTNFNIKITNGFGIYSCYTDVTKVDSNTFSICSARFHRDNNFSIDLLYPYGNKTIKINNNFIYVVEDFTTTTPKNKKSLSLSFINNKPYRSQLWNTIL